MGVLKWGPIFGLLVLAGCANPLTPSISSQYGIPQFSNAVEVMHWVHNYIAYEVQPTILTPKEILAEKVGDCKDYSILMMAILNEQFGETPKMIATSGAPFHAIVLEGSTYYDPTYDRLITNPVIYGTVGYYSAMVQAEAHATDILVSTIGAKS